MPEHEDLVPVAEAARRANIRPWRIHRWVRAGKLPLQQGRYGWLVSYPLNTLGEAPLPDGGRTSYT